MGISEREARRLGIISSPKKLPGRTGKAYITTAFWDARRISGGVVFVIPENMPSLNAWKCWHFGKQQRFKDRLSHNLALLALSVGSPQYERARVEVVHYFRVRRRRDSDNMAPKFLLDALRHAGVLVDDNVDVLELPEPRFEIDPARWRTEVWVYDQESQG